MQFPLFTPPTEWVMPDGYPDLSEAREVSIDLETCDPNLTSRGSGWPRKDGYVIGIAVAVDGAAWYFPIRHDNGSNLDAKQTLRWLADVCSVERDYIMHNAMYDLGWLWAEGIEVKGRIVDTMIVAALIDENRFSYALNALGRDYLNERKSEKDLYEAANSFGVNAKSEMWKLPAHFVGAYAEQDAALTLKLWQFFKGVIVKEDIADIFDLELQVLKVVFDMRKKGVRVDLEKAEELKVYLQREEEKVLQESGGTDIDIWAAASIAKAFDAKGLTYPKTPKSGQPSFTKNFLANHAHALPQAVVRARELNKARTTFIDTIIKHQHNGRIHAEAHSLRSDDGGTVTGRFSYSNPNLQQVPARNAEIGPMIRGLFLPEEGELWGAFDYSSQEPRLVVHYSSLLKLTGAQEFADQYNVDATTDFHQMAADIVGVPRKQAKDINLGLFYGMGKNKLAEQLGLEYEDAKDLFKEYHGKVPFVQQLADYVVNRASNKGVIRTLLGRKCRFDKWEPNAYGLYKPQTYEDAYAEHGPAIKRAFTYKALNRLIQGSAADQTKAAMVALHKEGITPLIQVHDELDISVAEPETASVIQEIMETCVDMQIPSVVDAEFGPSWGEAKKTFSDKPWSRGVKDGGTPMPDNTKH
jgi:DNA polymerase I-like protein with 3'-5' exonuclease and polymerase domains